MVRLRPWVKTVLGIIITLSMLFLCGMVDFEFKYFYIPVIALALMGISTYIINKFE